MGIISVLARLADIGERQEIQLRVTTTARRVHGEKNRPGETSSDEADQSEHLQESQVQIAIE